jgi:hypothetical protein
MQRALCKILTDESYRYWFESDKTSALSQFQLSARDVATLSGIDSKSLRYFAGVLAANRLETGLKSMPRVRTLLGVDFPSQYAHRYANDYPAIPQAEGSPVFAEFENLISFLHRLVKERAVNTPHFLDVLNYDSALFRLTADATLDARIREYEATYGPLETGKDDACPLRSPGAALCTVSPDFLGSSSGVEPTAGRMSDVLLFKSTHHPPRAFNVTPMTRRLLELCDGAMDLSTIGMILSDKTMYLDTDHAIQQCARVCRQLSIVGIVGVERA